MKYFRVTKTRSTFPKSTLPSSEQWRSSVIVFSPAKRDNIRNQRRRLYNSIAAIYAAASSSSRETRDYIIIYNADENLEHGRRAAQGSRVPAEYYHVLNEAFRIRNETREPTKLDGTSVFVAVTLLCY